MKRFFFVTLMNVLLTAITAHLAYAVTGTSNATLTLPSDGSVYTLDVSSQFDAFAINPASFTFSLAGGSMVKLSSSDKRLLNNSLNILTTCGATNSTLIINSAASQTVTITPGGVCSSATVTVSLNENIKHQIMEGLGSEPITPGFTRPGQPKMYIPPAIVKELFKIFHTDLGYTQSHFHIGINEPVNDNRDPLNFDWAKFVKGSGDDLSDPYLGYAPSLGLNSWATFGHHWATLYKQEWLLDNELSPKGNKYKLKAGMEDEYVENLLAQVLTYKKSGINVPYTGIYNEPVWSNNNGRSITPAQMVTIVKRLGKRLAEEGLFTKIHTPEDLSLNDAMLYIQALLADSEARKYVGALSYHTYKEVYADQPADAILSTSGQGNPPPAGVALRAELKLLSQQYGIPVWMTEVSGTTGTPHKIALARANHIHDEFTLADASLFIPEDFINYKFEGQGEPVDELIGVALDSAGNYMSHKINKGGYMMSQYAKFVRPGDVRIDTQSSDKKIRVTAFKNPVTGEIKVVAINNNAYSVQTEINVTGMAGTLTVVNGLRTSADENWAQVTPFVEGNTLTLVLTPESITSLTLMHSADQVLVDNNIPLTPLATSQTLAPKETTAMNVSTPPSFPPSALRSQTLAPEGPLSVKFSPGDRVQTTDALRVRLAPSLRGPSLGVQRREMKGTIIDAPVFSNRYTWWKIDFERGPDGWSAEDWLQKIVTAPLGTPPLRQTPLSPPAPIPARTLPPDPVSVRGEPVPAPTPVRTQIPESTSLPRSRETR